MDRLSVVVAAMVTAMALAVTVICWRDPGRADRGGGSRVDPASAQAEAARR